MAGRNRIYSVRKGSVQWNEDDRLTLVNILAKAGYCVRIGRCPLEGQEEKKNATYCYETFYLMP